MKPQRSTRIDKQGRSTVEQQFDQGT